MTHWATPLIGLPWAPAPADPPRAHFCWSLVQHALDLGYGVDMPALPLGEEEPAGVAAVKRAATGWHQVAAPARDMDVVLLRTAEGRHVALCIAVGPRLMLLHADGRLNDAGEPTGSVCAAPPEELYRSGRYLGAPEVWRRT